MTKLIALPLLADPRTGGWPTYTAHLSHGLMRAGWNPIIFRISKRSERTPRDFGRGLQYWNIALDELAPMAGQIPMLITAVGKSYRSIAADLMARGSSVVIHDPTELDQTMREALRETKVITIRQIIADKLDSEGIPNVFIGHPYERAERLSTEIQTRAITLSRVDFDKNTHVVVEANRILPENQQIQIYGTLNTLYSKIRLDEIDADWKRNYAGDWPAKSSTALPLQIAGTAEAVIDLSTIRGDGGGTQYSFLEIFDAGRPLIIHGDWLTGHRRYDEISPAIYSAINTAEALATAVTEPPSYDRSAATDILRNHDSERIAKQILQVLI